MKRLSIIIPVYNLEGYVENCLNSIFSQGLNEKDFEVIIVNDGSTDKTEEVVLKNLRPNCTYLKQENSRQGAARNRALRQASGKFVWYVDGDDIIAPNMLKKALECAEKNNLDLLFFPIIRRSKLGDKILSAKFPRSCIGKVLSGQNYLALRKLTLGPWYIFRRQMLIDNNLFFMEKVMFEDSEYMPRACFFSDRVMFADIFPYIANVREGSTTKSASPKHVLDLIKVFLKMSEFAFKHENSKAFPDLCFYAAMIFNTMFSRYRKLQVCDKLKIKIDGKIKEQAISCMLKSKFRKYIFEAIALKFAWRIFF